MEKTGKKYLVKKEFARNLQRFVNRRELRLRNSWSDPRPRQYANAFLSSERGKCCPGSMGDIEFGSSEDSVSEKNPERTLGKEWIFA
jgi:hypothetical protein